MNTDNIFVNTQSSIKIVGDKVIYFDPYKISSGLHDADIIFITHDHYDHMDCESINNVKNEGTVVVAPKSMIDVISQIEFNDYVYLNPNEDVSVLGVGVKTVPAYNISKSFHPNSNNWLGYVIDFDGVKYYIAGDTDSTIEASGVMCDIAFIPIGGIYTMDVLEVTELVKKINPKVVIPIHYGSIVGDVLDGVRFRDSLSDTSIEVIEKIVF